VFMKLVKFVVFVPETHKEKVKDAMFQAGGGRIGNYDSCSFETKGTGQFRPLEGSSPFLGEKDRVESVAEYRVEMISDWKNASAVLNALKRSHPYEEPAFDLIELMDFSQLDS